MGVPLPLILVYFSMEKYIDAQYCVRKSSGNGYGVPNATARSQYAQELWPCTCHRSQCKAKWPRVGHLISGRSKLRVMSTHYWSFGV